jgi:predicted amino acid-binding ACT domain protein
MSTSSKSVRVQLDEYEKEQLEEIIKPFGLLYNGKTSYTRILQAIALGKLQVNSPSTHNENKNKNKDNIIIKLDIVAPFYLAGVVCLITDAISKLDGNIIAINTQDDGKTEGVLQLLVQVKTQQGKSHYSHLLNILKSLDRILLDPLILKQFKYNTECRIEEAIKIYDDKEREREKNILKNIRNKYNDKNIGGEKINSEPIRKLIIGSKCTVPMRIKVLNKPGVVCEVTKKIAENSIFISHMQQKLDVNDINKAFIDLYLSFHPTSIKETENSLKNIKNIEEEIKKMNHVVIEVKNLDIKEFSI